jgi:hypothetical protein
MIEVPPPIYGITGGDNVFASERVWEGYVSRITDRVKEVSGVRDMNFFYRLEKVVIEERELVKRHGVESDDSVRILFVDDWSVAHMFDIRDDKNYHMISYSGIPEAHIDDISMRLREYYERCFNEFNEYFLPR